MLRYFYKMKSLVKIGSLSLKQWNVLVVGLERSLLGFQTTVLSKKFSLDWEKVKEI